MKRDGSMVRRYDSTAARAMAMVGELVQMSPVVLKIQDEMAIQKKPLIETLAGRSIHASLRDDSQKHAEELAELNAELVRAITSSKFTVPFTFSVSNEPYVQAKSNADSFCADLRVQKTTSCKRSSKP